MAYLVGKKQDGKTYYYLTESARVNGKPRIVSQRYLGSAAEIAERLSKSGPGEPDRSRHLSFGDIAAVWAMLERLGVVDIVNDVVGVRRKDARASVGTYIALAVLNRVVAPCSKLQFAEWFAKTAGDRLVKLPLVALDHRRFWDAMDEISQEQLIEIERRILTKMVAATLPTNAHRSRAAGMQSKSAPICAWLVLVLWSPPMEEFRSSAMPMRGIATM